MYITNMELIKQKLTAEGRLSTSDIIKQILKDEDANPAKRYMAVGKQYYDGAHDILQHDFRQSWVYDEVGTAAGIDRSGHLITNENNSNHHNVHNIYQQQVDQKTAYIVGKPPSVTVEGAEDHSELKSFEDAVTAVTSDEEFADTLNDYVTGASNKGVEWLHVYYDKAGMLQYVVTPAEEVIPFYDSVYQKELVELIRYYSVAVVADGKETLRKKIEWWTKENVTYYEESESGDYILDQARSLNPAAHWYKITSKDGLVTRREPHGWGRVPFIPLYNNGRHASDLTRIKGLQDAYNLISSASTNNQIDLVELYWIVQGYGGETVKAIQRKLQMNKAVSISDPQGKVSAEQVTLGVQDRLAWLDMLRSDMYSLGMAIDTTADKFATAPSGVALKFLYTPLDQKANMLVVKLKRALKEFMWFVAQDINLKQGTDYDSSLIRVDVNKTVITNDAETVTMIQQSQGIVPDTILLAKHPFVDDVNQALKDLEKQREEAAKRFLDGDVPPGDGEGEDE